QFIMTNVVPGEQKVAYVGGPMSTGSSDGSRTAPAEKAVAVPPKFGDFQTSGVTVTVPDAGGARTGELKCLPDGARTGEQTDALKRRVGLEEPRSARRSAGRVWLNP